MTFTGLTDADFDAYRPERWSSNVYNRQRLETKQKAVALGREVQAMLAAEGLALESFASDEHPSLWNGKKVDAQWVFLSRTAQDRKTIEQLLDHKKTLASTLQDPTPYLKHVFLSLRIDHEKIEFALKLHHDAWVDGQNLIALAAGDQGRHELIEKLRALSAGFSVGITGGRVVDAVDCDEASLVALIEEYAEGSQWLYVGRTLERQAAVSAGGALAAEGLAAFAAVTPLYRLIAWRPDNDRVSVADEIAKNEGERAVLHAELEAQKRERAEREAADAANQKIRAEQKKRELRREGPISRDRVHRPARPRAPAPAVGEERPPAIAAAVEPARAPVVPVPIASVASGAEGPPQVGDRVRIESGALRGKVGLVEEAGARGVLKVRLGVMAIRLDARQLANLGPTPPSAQARALPTSHRRFAGFGPERQIPTPRTPRPPGR